MGEGIDTAEVRKIFLELKKAEGYPDNIAETLWQDYAGAGHKSDLVAEGVKVQTYVSEEYNKEWRESHLVGRELLIRYANIAKEWEEGYLRNYGNNSHHDSLEHALKRSDVLEYGSFFQWLIPSMKLLDSAHELALEARYPQSFILLRPAIEGALKSGVRAWISRDAETTSEDLAGGITKITIPFKGEGIFLDDEGLRSLSKEAEELGVCEPVADVWSYLKVYDLNSYIHQHLEKLKNTPGSFTLDSFDSESCKNFGTIYGRILETFAIISHNLARLQDWWDVRKMEFDVPRISKVFPMFAEGLVTDGLVRNCIDCQKHNPKNLENQRGRCKKCFEATK